MASYYLDWANLILRWVHVITVIAWIGSSFYFVFLDSSLTPAQDEDLKKKGVSGELWAVHGGGFYHPVKFNVSPPELPQQLHWFYWEAYSTWLSGFALFAVSYLWSADTYLIDKSLIDWSASTAICVALSFLVLFWLAYDAICRVFGQRNRGDLLVGVLVCALVSLAAWAACHWFAGRAAFLLVGAMLATSMSANVLFWIIPGQKKVVAQIRAGEPVDAVHGRRGKQRSVHNTYFTLPVVFAMLSGHYSFTYGHAQNWLVLILMMLAGALIRKFFVMRHGHRLGRNGNPMPYALGGMALVGAMIVSLQPTPSTQSAVPPKAVSYAQLQQVLAQRCYLCHGERLQMKNVRLDSRQNVKTQAQNLYQQAVVLKLMPLNNATGITESERTLIKAWFDAGAPVD